MDNMFPLVAPTIKSGSSSSFNPLDHLGNLGPWQSVSSLGLPNASPVIPSGCSLKQVHLLHRHGARYPTSGSAPSAFAAKVHSTATGKGFLATGALTFLNTWTYKLGAEILTPFGRAQLYVNFKYFIHQMLIVFRFDLGVAFRVKYGTFDILFSSTKGSKPFLLGQLLDDLTDLPVLRTTSEGIQFYTVLNQANLTMNFKLACSTPRTL